MKREEALRAGKIIARGSTHPCSSNTTSRDPSRLSPRFARQTLSRIKTFIACYQEDWYHRFIDHWRPNPSQIEKMSKNMCHGEIRDQALLGRYVDAFLGQTPDAKDSFRLRCFNDLLRRGHLDRQRLLTAMVDYTITRSPDDLDIRRRLFEVYDVTTLDKDLIDRLFDHLATAADVNALCRLNFSQEKIDSAFANMFYRRIHQEENRAKQTGAIDTISVFKAFLEHWKPSEHQILYAIPQFYETHCIDVLELLREKRYLLFDERHETPFTQDMFKICFYRPNPYAIEFLLLKASMSTDPKLEWKLKVLLNHDVGPLQQIVDEAFRIVVDRGLPKCIDTFLKAPKNRPTDKLVRQLVSPNVID